MPVRLGPEHWEEMCGRIARAEPPVAWTWFATHGQRGWQIGGLCIRSATHATKALRRYRDVAFGSESIAPKTAARRLRSGMIGVRGAWAESLAIPRLDGDVGGVWAFAGENLYLASTDWPSYYVSNRLSIDEWDGPPAYGPLAARGEPYYPWFGPAVAELVFGIPAQSLQNYSSPMLVVRLSDRRARMGGLDARDGDVIVRIESGVDREELHLRAAWRADAGDMAWQQYACPIEGGEIQVPTGVVPSEMAIAVVAPDGFVLDQTGWGQSSDAPVAIPEDLEGRVLRWLAEGESRTVEYKQGLKERATRERFGRTVAALANGGGGVVLIGVDDGGRVIGYDAPKVADSITDSLRESLSDHIDVDIRSLVIKGRPVYVVLVPPGDPALRPYRWNGHITIRANATTREATTNELRSLCAEPAAAGWPRTR